MTNGKCNYRGRKGFTLIELLIVMLIALMIIPIYAKVTNGSKIKSQETVIKADFRTFQMGLENVLRSQAGLPFKDGVIDKEQSIEIINTYLDSEYRVEGEKSKQTDPWGKKYSVIITQEDGIQIIVRTKGKNDQKDDYDYKLVVEYTNGSVYSQIHGLTHK